MTYSLFLTHRALPGRRDDLITAWRAHMPAAIDANPGHHAYVYTTVDEDPDALMVYQQYESREAAAQFLRSEAYLAYLADSEQLLSQPPAVTAATPLWSKNVGH